MPDEIVELTCEKCGYNQFRVFSTKKFGGKILALKCMYCGDYQEVE